MFKSPGVLILQSKHKFSFNFKCTKLKHNWIAPRGYDSGIKVYCRAKNDNVPLIFLNKHFVKWYICGPTVYDSSHIGHASCYIRLDLINRILKEFFNIKSIIALGITDIDDKIIKGANKKKVHFRVLAKHFEFEFFSQLNLLNVLPPHFVLRVSEHIPDIINFISKIIDKGDAYTTEDGSVYFNNPEPQKDSNLILPKVSSPLPVGKKSPSDFALWKSSKADEPYWESPWGRGRPGWHVECSAMASKIFGSQLDLHGGGIDLLFPHHANEERQSCSYHDCNQWVNYWLHTGVLEISDEKMSKSLNNFVSIAEFLKNNTADHLRMFCFISKYNRGLHWNENALHVPATHCNLISNFLGDCDCYVKGNWSLGNISESALLQQLSETQQKVRMHLMNDFDTANCHRILMELVRKTTTMMNKSPDFASGRSPAAVAAVSQYICDVFNSFGFQLGSAKGSLNESQKLEFIVDQAVSFRDQVRSEAMNCQEKSVKEALLRSCDSLRHEFGSVGIIIKDQGRKKSAWSHGNIEKTNKKDELGRSIPSTIKAPKFSLTTGSVLQFIMTKYNKH